MAQDLGARNEVAPIRPAMFHYFTDGDRHPRGQGALDADQFLRILESIGLERILPADEWRSRFVQSSLTPDLTCLTFDDNLRCQFDVALPVMEDLGLTAFRFVYSSPLEGVVERLELYRYFRTVAFDSVEDFYGEFFAEARESAFGEAIERDMASFEPSSWHPELRFYTDDDRRFRYLRDGVLAGGPYDQIMEAMIEGHGFEKDRLIDLLWMDSQCWKDLVGEGHVIGLHSHTHPTAIADLPMEVQRQEYRVNAEMIGESTGVWPTTAAHPSGSYSADTLEILTSLGVELAFAVGAGVCWQPNLEIQRIDSTDLLERIS